MTLDLCLCKLRFTPNMCVYMLCGSMWVDVGRHIFKYPKKKNILKQMRKTDFNERFENILHHCVSTFWNFHVMKQFRFCKYAKASPIIWHFEVQLKNL